MQDRQIYAPLRLAKQLVKVGMCTRNLLALTLTNASLNPLASRFLNSQLNSDAFSGLSGWVAKVSFEQKSPRVVWVGVSDIKKPHGVFNIVRLW